LGPAPLFDGPRCQRCGNRYRIQRDHIDPVANGGDTTLENTNDLCVHCHLEKTLEDRKAGRLRRRGPPTAA